MITSSVDLIRFWQVGKEEESRYIVPLIALRHAEQLSKERLRILRSIGNVAGRGCSGFSIDTAFAMYSSTAQRCFQKRSPHVVYFPFCIDDIP